MARNICSEDFTKYNGSPVKAPVANVLLLQAANKKALTNLNSKAQGDFAKTLKELIALPSTKKKPWAGRGDGLEIAMYLTKQFQDPNAPKDIKDMVAEAKKSYPIIGTLNEASTGVRVRFYETMNKDMHGKGTGYDVYNFFFNLDIIDPFHFQYGDNLYKEIVTVTFHTDIDDTAVTLIGGFHIKDKSSTNPKKHNNFIRIKICQQADGTFKLSKVYTSNGGNINFTLIDPFIRYFIQEFENYINTGFKTRMYVNIVPPAPVLATPVLATPVPTASTVKLTVNNLMKKFALNENTKASTGPAVSPVATVGPASINNGSAWGGYKKRKNTRRRKQRKSKTRKNRTA